MIRRILPYLIFAFVLLVTAYAKRTPPPEIAPVVHDGVRYAQVVWVFQIGEKQNGGVVEARDVKTGRFLWRVKVYATKYDDSLEQDVQDVFITSMRIEHEELVIENELHQRYILNLRTHVARKA